ncbi:MAG: hypothetical protein QM800_01460 [Paludibacter sp.]
MIEEQVKVHDKFSMEFKVGFIARKDQKTNDFAMNIWMFIPNSLDINRFTYSKTNFYRDLKSNIRQITPVWKLNEMDNGNKSPLNLLRKSLTNFAQQPTDANQQDYEFHVKMFQSILKSALREEVRLIKDAALSETLYLTEEFYRLVLEISAQYRQLLKIIDIPSIDKSLREYFLFGDEFMSNVIEFQTFRLMDRLKKKDPQIFELVGKDLQEIISMEIAYRQRMGYLLVEKNAEKNNHELVNRLSLLKKYIESHLYLNIDKRKDGVLVEQFLFSLAAGISMIFATGIAFSIQQRYGSFTMPLFVALVISYMLKDRIKEMTRFYFAHKMGKRYFDHKATMNINQTDIGWAKESMDFVSETKLPPAIVKARNCTSIIEANNRANSEKVLLYRMQMQMDREKLNTNSEFSTDGINSIIRFNFSEFIRNMDNPEFALYYPDEAEGFEVIEGEKLYYLNFIIEKKNDTQNETKRYRIALNRNGIKKIQKFESDQPFLVQPSK